MLSSEDKDPYESQASAAKEKYQAAMAKYKKTEEYKEHTQYLADFKVKNASNAGTRIAYPCLGSPPCNILANSGRGKASPFRGGIKREPFWGCWAHTEDTYYWTPARVHEFSVHGVHKLDWASIARRYARHNGPAH